MSWFEEQADRAIEDAEEYEKLKILLPKRNYEISQMKVENDILKGEIAILNRALFILAEDYHGGHPARTINRITIVKEQALMELEAEGNNESV